MSAVEPRQPERTLPELLSAMTQDVSELVRKELELAREEVKVEVKHAGDAAKFLGSAGFVAYLAVLMLVFAAAWGLDAVLPTGFAFLVVGLVLGAVAAVLALRGRDRLKTLDPKPQQTIETLKEDAQWLSERKS
ncbi:MAG: phage holin family protein [Acidimicrobiales bacterium]